MKWCQRFVAPHRSYMLEDEAEKLLLKKVADPYHKRTVIIAELQ